MHAFSRLQRNSSVVLARDFHHPQRHFTISLVKFLRFIVISLPAERGVDDTLAEQLADYCAAKEQTEYVGWLGEYGGAGVTRM